MGGGDFCACDGEVCANGVGEDDGRARSVLYGFAEGKICSRQACLALEEHEVAVVGVAQPVFVSRKVCGSS